MRADVSKSADWADIARQRSTLLAIDIVVSNAGVSHHVFQPMLEGRQTGIRPCLRGQREIDLSRRRSIALPVFRQQGRRLLRADRVHGWRFIPVGLIMVTTAQKGCGDPHGGKSDGGGSWRDNIRVNCINPVAGETPLLAIGAG